MRVRLEQLEPRAMLASDTTPPTDVILSSTSIAESQPVGTTVGTLSTTDPDAGDSFTYALVSGAGAMDNASFTVVGNDLLASASFDYETKSSYSIRVRSTDPIGLSVEKMFTVKVVNLGEAAPNLQQGLLAHFPLDGDARDSSANQQHGTGSNVTAARDRFGVENAALYFNGTNASVSIPHHHSFNSLPLSMSMWFQTTATTGGLVGKYQASGWNGYQVSLGNGGRVFPWYVKGMGRDVIGGYDIPGGRNPSFESPPVNDGQWHHLVFTVDASGGALFVDGILQATKEWRGEPTVVTTSLPLYIGRYFGEANGYFNGVIDDVRLYNRVISPAEVGLLNASRPPTDITISATSIAENQPSGTTVGTLSTSDPDAGEVFTYTLVPGDGSADNSAFTIAGDQLHTAALFDYEIKSSYSIRVRATDRGGLFTEKTFTISVTDVRSTVFWLSNGAIYRGASDGSFHHVVVGAPQNTGGTITNLAVDQSGTRLYWSEVSSMPGTSKIYSSAVDGSDIRTVYNGSSLGWINYGMAVDEAAGYVFLHSHDPAPVVPIGPHYDGAIQRINIGTGEVVPFSSTIWYARLFADTSSGFVYYTDISGFASGGPSIYSLNGLKKQGYDGSSPISIPVAGEVPSGPVVVDAAAGKLYYATGEGSQPKGIWSVDISGGGGTLLTAPTKSVYGIGIDAAAGEVMWADGDGIHRIQIDGTQLATVFSAATTGTFAQHTSGFFVVPDEPITRPVDVALSATTVPEHLPAGTIVGTLSTQSLGAPSEFTYELLHPDDIDLHGDIDSFVISGNVLRTTVPLDYELKSSYAIRIRSTATNGLSTEKEFSIAVGNVNEAPGSAVPTITFDNVRPYQDFTQYVEPGFVLRATPGAVRINDGFSQGNNAAQPSFGFGQGMDSRLTLSANGGQPFDLLAMDLLEATGFPAAFSVVVTGTRLDNSIVSATLTLDGVSGAETFALPATFRKLTSVVVRENPFNSHPIDIVAIDNLVVHVEPISLSASTVAENAAVGTVVGVFSTSDPDVGDSFTYTLVSGLGATDNASFTIEGGALRTAAPFNFEAKNSYSVRVRSTDAGGLFTEKTFAIAVSDVAESPAAPLISVPAMFSVIEDVASPLEFAFPTITDHDSPYTKTVTVRLTVADGTIMAVSADGVTVGGRATSRTFSGSIAALNDYFSAVPARIRYLASPDNVAARSLTATVTEVYGERRLASSMRSRIVITPVNDAPTVVAPGSFMFTEDTRGNLAWLGAVRPFGDVDSASLAVTLSVADGEIAATSTKAVVVGGVPTARTFSGTVASLNAYFRRVGAISYMPARDNTSARVLTTTVSDGLLSTSAASTMFIRAVNDAPTVAAATTLKAPGGNAPFQMTFEMLWSAVKAVDVDGPSASLVITQLDSGTLQRWNGTAWVTMSLAASVPRSQRMISAGQAIRWVPPAGATGARPAFRVRAWDGEAMSSAVSRITVEM